MEQLTYEHGGGGASAACLLSNSVPGGLQNAVWPKVGWPQKKAGKKEQRREHGQRPKGSLSPGSASRSVVMNSPNKEVLGRGDSSSSKEKMCLCRKTSRLLLLVSFVGPALPGGSHLHGLPSHPHTAAHAHASWSPAPGVIRGPAAARLSSPWPSALPSSPTPWS